MATISIFDCLDSIGIQNHGGARKAAIDDDDLAGDEAVVQDQAQHAVGNVVFGAATLERRIFGAPRHQPFVVSRQRPFHPLALDPARRYGVDADFRAESVGESLSQVGHRRFAGGVGQRLRARSETGDAAGVDDAAVGRLFSAAAPRRG